MKTTVLGHSLLLVVILAVSWSAADDVLDQESERELQEFLNSRPFTPHPFYSSLYNRYPFNSIPYHSVPQRGVVIDPFAVVTFIGNNERWFSQQGDNDESDNLNRRKRQATFDFGMQHGPNGRNYHASAGIKHTFNNDRSSVGVSGHRNWGASGRSEGLAIGFSHRFRR